MITAAEACSGNAIGQALRTRGRVGYGTVRSAAYALTVAQLAARTFERETGYRPSDKAVDELADALHILWRRWDWLDFERRTQAYDDVDWAGVKSVVWPSDSSASAGDNR